MGRCAGHQEHGRHARQWTSSVGTDNSLVTSPTKRVDSAVANRRPAALAWTLWAIALTLAAVAAVFTYLDIRFVPGYVALEETGIPIALTYGTVGAFIASRRPQNKVG